MIKRIDKNGLQVDERLARFVDDEALPGSGVSADAFWAGFAGLVEGMAPKNRDLLAHRDAIQTQIDDWHSRHRNQPHDHEGYKAFLKKIGYLVEEGPDFEIETTNVDPEIAKVPG
ncbi:MAG: malate synthase G, partial [Pseudomonadota bacterium]